MMNDEVIKLIENRRSIRSFEERPLDPEVLDKLKRLTLRCPTGGRFSVIEIVDQSKKDKLCALCENQVMISRAPGVWLFLSDMERFYSWMKEKKCAENFGESLDKPGIGTFHLGMQDAIIAAQNAVIASEAMGMHSCFVGDIIENYEEIQAMFNLPKYAVPACLLIFGYAKTIPTSPLTSRPEPEYVFMKDGYKHQSVDECEKMYEKNTASFKERGVLPFDNTGSYIDWYYRKKYTSDWMAEMSRSVGVFLDRWLSDEA